MTPCRRASLASLLTIAWAIAFMVPVSQYPFPHVFSHDVDSPIIALELSRDAADIGKVLHGGDSRATHSMALANWLDLGFIPLYALALWTTARVFRGATRLLSVAILVTALFDYLEDWRISQALGGAAPPIYIFSLVKWAGLGLVLLSLGWILASSTAPVYSLPTRRLLAIAYWLAGILILADVVFGTWIGYSRIALALEIFTITLFVNAAGLWRPKEAGWNRNTN